MSLCGHLDLRERGGEEYRLSDIMRCSPLCSSLLAGPIQIISLKQRRPTSYVAACPSRALLEACGAMVCPYPGGGCRPRGSSGNNAFTDRSGQPPRMLTCSYFPGPSPRVRQALPCVVWRGMAHSSGPPAVMGIRGQPICTLPCLLFFPTVSALCNTLAANVGS